MTGKTVFVPYALPGELVEAHIVDDRRSFLRPRSSIAYLNRPTCVWTRCDIFPSAAAVNTSMPEVNISCRSSSTSCATRLSARVFHGQRARGPERQLLGRCRDRLHLLGVPRRIRLHTAWTSPPRRGPPGALLPGARLACRSARHALPHRRSGAGRGDRRSLADRQKANWRGWCDEIEFFTNGEGDQLLVSLRIALPESQQQGLAEL